MDNDEVVIGYIKRSITDIARKCNKSDVFIIETFKKVICKIN